MSINTKQSIKCPSCGQMHPMNIWNSITVSDSPDLKEDLLHGNVNIFLCPSCGHKGLVPVPMLYRDEEKRLVISFSPCDDQNLAERLFENVRTSSRESGELERLEGYHLRFVTDYNSLLEKILIFEQGFSDKTIEVIKLMILSQDAEKMDQRVCRFGKTTEQGIEFMVQDFKEGQIYTSTAPLETYQTIHEQLRVSGVKPYSFDWERVDGAYASALLGIQ